MCVSCVKLCVRLLCLSLLVHSVFGKGVTVQDPNGAACAINQDCVPGTSCVGKLCKPIGKMGAPCDDLEDCSGTLRCIRGLCSKRSELGGNCEREYILEEGDCASNLACINSTCVRPSGSGGVCTWFWHCQRGLTCIAGKCRPKSRNGGPCDSSVDCLDAICRKRHGNELGTCDPDIRSILASVVAFTFVIVTTGTLQFCAWRPRVRG